MYYLIFTFIFTINTHFGPSHIIPHTHDDLGWNWTVEEYYNKWVKDIFQNTLSALERNKERKFVYSETGFLKIFLNDGHKDLKIDRIKNLINNKQWEFVNGGISQADEACPHYDDLINNYFYGLWYLKRNFGVKSITAWQLDPFGHSKGFAYIASLFGFQDLVIGRISERDKDQFGRKYEKNMTLNWVFPDGKNIRTHMSNSSYNPPEGTFCEPSCRAFWYTLFNKGSTDWYFAETKMQFTYDPWYFFGNDFWFSDAEADYFFLEKLIDEYKDLKQSLFSDYLENIKNYPDRKLLDFDQDFFVYEEQNGDSWSGYFSTKPDLKRKIRELGQLLRAFKTWKVLRNQDLNDHDELLDILEESGIFMHHDSITGTAKRYVDEDYMKRMSSLEDRVLQLLKKDQNNEIFYVNEYQYLQGLKDGNFKNNEDLYLLTLNQASSQRLNHIQFSFPIQNKKKLILKNSQDNQIDLVKETCFKDRCQFSFYDELKTMDFQKFKIEYVNEEHFVQDLGKNDQDYSFTIKNNLLCIQKNEKIVYQVSLWKINSSKSGPYLLKYESFTKSLVNLNDVIIEQQNDNVVVKAIGQDFFVSLIYNKKKLNVFKVLVTFLKVSLFQDGYDLILQFDNPNIENDEFITDSNGLFEMNRKKGEKWETSVYPINSHMIIQDKDSQNKMAYMTSVSKGGLSSYNGNMMIYIQRSANVDDSKGVDEILRVSNPFLVESWLILYDNDEQWENDFYDVQFWINNTPQIYYQQGSEFKESTDKKISNQNIRLTVDIVDQSRFILRLQNRHRNLEQQFDSNEIENLFEKDIEIHEVDFDHLFKDNGEKRSLEQTMIFKPFEFKTLLITFVQLYQYKIIYCFFFNISF